MSNIIIMKQRLWLAIGAFALAGCADLCAGDTGTASGFAAMDLYADQITACLRGEGCDQLCADVFHLDAQIESCMIASVVGQDATVQSEPLSPSIDPLSLRGVNLSVTYVEPGTCAQATVIAGAGGSTDDGSGDDGSCDGSCDDGSGDDGSGDDGSGDDGSGDDGSGDDGSGDDGSGDDGSGDDGSGDDGSGDDGSGDIAPAPTPVSRAGRAPAAPVGPRHAGHGIEHR